VRNGLFLDTRVPRDFGATLPSLRKPVGLASPCRLNPTHTAAISSIAMRGPAAERRRSIELAHSSLSYGAPDLTLGRILLGFLMRMTSDQDRAARHEQKRIDPSCDMTITRIAQI
jgi:hypothetical protein